MIRQPESQFLEEDLASSDDNCKVLSTKKDERGKANLPASSITFFLVSSTTSAVRFHVQPVLPTCKTGNTHGAEQLISPSTEGN